MPLDYLVEVRIRLAVAYDVYSQRGGTHPRILCLQLARDDDYGRPSQSTIVYTVGATVHLLQIIFNLNAAVWALTVS